MRELNQKLAEIRATKNMIGAYLDVMRKKRGGGGETRFDREPLPVKINDAVSSENG